LTTRALHLVPKPESPPDTVAFERVAHGDVGALGDIYDRHAAPLLRFASRAAGPHDAEDIVQQTFMLAAKIAATYDGRAATARSWLYGITARLIQERRRSVARFARALMRLSDVTARAHDPTGSPRSDIERGLATLSDAKRVVLVLAEIEGYTCEEIAEMLEIPVGTVWTRLHHARKNLRTFYEGAR
jgi:RNA polymerase sigma factor (sigma-70 family)